MLFALPPDDTLYDALVARDPHFDGRAFVGVTSTGIFCRLTCPARKPKRENCRFFESVSACLEAGFRACKRCHPLTPSADADPSVAHLINALSADPGRRWTEADVAALGLDPSTVRRTFRRHYGMTFLKMARLSRVKTGMKAMSSGARVVDAQFEAGYESASAFRAAFARLLGDSPARFTGRESLKADILDTPMGPMLAVCDDTHLHLLEFAERKALKPELARLRKAVNGDLGVGRTPITEQIECELTRFFAGEDARFETPLALHGTDFTQRVWTELRSIPAGATRSYGEVARAIGQPTATRAVARANGANQIAIVIPCHRVIGADGTLTGYGGGLWRKQSLIDLERRYAAGNTEGRAAS
tara:strand:- start:1029 stop:2108 length:1080 start_codon:yes stop_codon:yes gene_type:complete